MSHIRIDTINSEQKRSSILTWLLLFVLSYFFLYCNSGMFLTGFLTNWIYAIVVPQFANLLGVNGVEEVPMTGSGDTQYDYFVVLFMLIISLMGSTVFFFTTKKKSTIDNFLKIVYMLVRYFVIYMMLIYGLSKVFYLQFRFPTDYALDVKLGDKSPMGLMWTFMGYSEGYTMFVGWLEFLAGLFLLFRRTTVLGALMTFGVMLNVFALNMFYDVPVKLFSFHIVLMSLFLLFPIRKEVAGFFLSRDRIVRGVIPFFDYGIYNNIMFWAKVGLLSIVLIRMAAGDYSLYRDSKSTESIIGEYKVLEQHFFADGIENTDTSYIERWGAVPFLGRKSICVEYNEGRKIYYQSLIDTDSQTIGMKLRTDPDSLHQMLNYTIDEKGSLHLNGNLYSDSISVILNKVDKNYLLKERGFNWVQEYPFNR